MVTGAKKKGGKKNKDDDFTWDWDQERLRAVTFLYNLVQLPLNPLFDPPMMEEEVVTQISGSFQLLKQLKKYLCPSVHLSQKVFDQISLS